MYNRFLLNNGVRVVTENIPYVKSVSIGIWIKTGSRYENSLNNGVSHFIEHMLFKGTNNRTAKQIAESIDSIGGQMNAFTSKECTCFYAKVLDNHLHIAVDVLSDMLFNSKFDESDIEREKSVVIEEINMYEDSPEELAHDLLSQSIFNDHPLSLPILGNTSVLRSLTRDDILDYFRKYYTPDNTVISVAGNINVAETLKLLERYFGNWKAVQASSQTDKMPFLCQGIINRVKDTEQMHLCIGMEGVPQGRDELYSLLVVNNIFGGSMSSRLFQKIREDKGLVYSVYSYPTSYKDIGTFTIYAGLSPTQVLTVSELIIKEIDTIKNEDINFKELYKAKEQLKGNFILGLESTSSRMTSLGKSELLLGKISSPKEIIEEIDKVNIEDIKQTIDKTFNSKNFNISYVGNIENDKLLNDKLKKIYFR